MCNRYIKLVPDLHIAVTNTLPLSINYTLKEVLVSISSKKIALADRTLMPGDVVRRLVPGKDTQRGYCRDISMHADVKVLGTKYVIKNVMTERLRPINNWQRDSAVCLDSWVGSTKDVEEKAVLRLPAKQM